MMKGKYWPLAVALALLSGGVTLRLLPHPTNFAPITAIGIFGGAVLPRRLSVWVPLTAMILSDLFIGFYDIMPLTWACYGVIAIVSNRCLRVPTARGVAAVTLSASLFFFVVTNFAVWVASGLYAHTWSGFWQCYAMALPFFRNTLLSDLLYTGALFGVYAVVTHPYLNRQETARA